MSILVDDAIWHFRDRRWCHLVSDTDLAELHAFAAGLGIPPRGFHGDHYDLPEEHRLRAIAAGARPVTSRELLSSLQDSGLRLSPSQRRDALRRNDIG